MGSTEQYGQYTILGRIGEGAHGIVFKAKHIEVILARFIWKNVLKLLCMHLKQIWRVFIRVAKLLLSRKSP